MNYKIIIPLVKKCKKCKNGRVTSHHFLCNNCWGEKAKTKYFKNKKKLLLDKNGDKIIPKYRSEKERLNSNLP